MDDLKRQLENWQEKTPSFVIKNILNQTQEFSNNTLRQNLEALTREETLENCQKIILQIIQLLSSIETQELRENLDNSEKFIALAKNIISQYADEIINSINNSQEGEPREYVESHSEASSNINIGEPEVSLNDDNKEISTSTPDKETLADSIQKLKEKWQGTSSPRKKQSPRFVPDNGGVYERLTIEEQIKDPNMMNSTLQYIIDRCSNMSHPLVQNIREIQRLLEENDSESETLAKLYLQVLNEITPLLDSKDIAAINNLEYGHENYDPGEFIQEAQTIIRIHEGEIINFINNSSNVPEEDTKEESLEQESTTEETQATQEEAPDLEGDSQKNTQEELTDEEILGSIFPDANLEELLKEYEEWQAEKEKINKLFVPPDEEVKSVARNITKKSSGQSQISICEIMPKIMYAVCQEEDIPIQKPITGNNDYTKDGNLREADDTRIFREESYEYFLLSDKRMILYNIEAKHFLYYFPFAVDDPGYWCGLEKSKLNILANHKCIHKLQKNTKKWEHWTNNFRKMITIESQTTEDELKLNIKNGTINFQTYPVELFGINKGCYVSVNEETQEEEVWTTMHRAYEKTKIAFREKQQEAGKELWEIYNKKQEEEKNIITKKEKELFKEFILYMVIDSDRRREEISQDDSIATKQLSDVHGTPRTGYNIGDIESIIKSNNVLFPSYITQNYYSQLPPCYKGCTMYNDQLLINLQQVNKLALPKDYAVLQAFKHLMLKESTPIILIPILSKRKNNSTQTKSIQDIDAMKPNKHEFTCFFPYDEIIKEIQASKEVHDQLKDPNQEIQKYVVTDNLNLQIVFKKMLYILKLKRKDLKVKLQLQGQKTTENLNFIAAVSFFLDHKAELEPYIELKNIQKKTIKKLISEYLRLIKIFRNSDYRSLDDFNNEKKLADCRKNFKDKPETMNQNTSEKQDITDSDFYKLYLLKDMIEKLLNELENPTKKDIYWKIKKEEKNILNGHNLTEQEFEKLVEDINKTKNKQTAKI